MSNTRPSTPLPIARQLRQEAGFGCCKCGYPIVEYHHIIPYSKEPHFRPADMMALCPNCHTEATGGALTSEKQRDCKLHPFNLMKGFARGLLFINEEKPVVDLGGNKFTGGGTLVSVDDQPMIALEINESRSLDLSLMLYDEHDLLLLHISRNEWLSGDPLPWDIDAGSQTLSIRRKKGEIAFNLDCRKSPIELKGSFWRSGRLIHIAPRSITVDRTELNFKLLGCEFERVCLSFQTSPKPMATIKPNICLVMD